MPELPDRDAIEARLARLIGRELQNQFHELMNLIGDPPNLSNVPESYWNNGGKELRNILEPELTAIFMTQAELLMNTVNIGVDWTLVNQRAVDFARSYTFDLVSGIVERDKVLLQSAIGDYFAQDLSIGQLTSRLSGAYGPVRAEMIAVTETTRAAVEGEKALAAEIEKMTGVIRMVGYWITERDGNVCAICQVNDRKPTAEVGFPPLHPRCRCNVRYEIEANENSD